MKHPRPAAPVERIQPDSALAHAAGDFVLAVELPPVAPRQPAAATAWQPLQQRGSELWLDAADRDSVAAQWTPAFAGITTNNTLLQREVDKGSYDALIPRAAAALRQAEPELAEADLLLEVAQVLNAVHGRSLALALQTKVSVELHTDLAHDAERSFEYGRRLHRLCPEHFVVKVPLTPAGLLAARWLEADGVPVNVTLGFSARQNLLAGAFAKPHFVNVFLGRIDALLEQSGLDIAADAGVAAAWASQRLLRQTAEADGVRQIAASLRSGAQVAPLAGIDVLTMPVAVAEEFAQRGAELAAGEPAPMPLDDELRGSRVDTLFEAGTMAPVAARQLQLRHADALDAERIAGLLQDHDLGDLLPVLSEADQGRLAADGKIPDWRYWLDAVREGRASWDGLLNAAGLLAFARDQHELDDRIRRSW